MYGHFPTSGSDIFSFSNFRRSLYLRYGEDDDNNTELGWTTSAEAQFYLENTQGVMEAHSGLAWNQAPCLFVLACAFITGVSI